MVEYRVELIQCKVTPKEKVMIEEHCKRRGEGLSDYVRGATLTCMIMEGNTKALALLAEKARESVRKRLEEWIEATAKAA